MADNIQLVFSRPPEGLDPGEYDRWYEGHVGDILAVEGYEAVRRFALHAANGEAVPTMYSHLALYVIGGEPADTLARLQRAVRDGTVALPDWFDDVRFASFVGHGLEGPIDLESLDHTYVVFSTPPARIPHPDYFEWYATHMRENLTADGFEVAWRYRLEPEAVDPLAPSDAIHAALYQVHGELPQLRAALKEAADAGRVGFPDWFWEITFGSVDALACSPARTT